MSEIKKIKIAAMGDMHFHGDFKRMYRNIFADASEKADVFLLCGDLTSLGLPEEAENLARDLGACRIPVLAVLGNHDLHSGRAYEIKKILTASGRVIFLDDQRFISGQTGFVGIKGFGGGFGSHMIVSFGEPQTKNFVSEAIEESLKLESSLKDLNTQNKIVVMHYAPILETIKGEDPEIFPFMGCSRFAEVADRFGVSAIFHGHAHRGQAEGLTAHGIPVYNCCRDILQQDGLDYLLIEI